MDEILALRALWERKDADVREIAQVLQRGFDQAETVLKGMEKKLMVERAGIGRFVLSSGIRSDIDIYSKPTRCICSDVDAGAVCWSKGHE